MQSKRFDVFVLSFRDFVDVGMSHRRADEQL